VFCDYTLETGDNCGRAACVKFVERDFWHFACETHDVPLYTWLRAHESATSTIVAEFLPMAWRARAPMDVLRCDDPGCFNVAEKYAGLDGAHCHEHWAPWCEDGDCELPASYVVQIEAAHEGYQPSEERFACVKHWNDCLTSMAWAWHGLGVQDGMLNLGKVRRPRMSELRPRRQRVAAPAVPAADRCDCGHYFASHDDDLPGCSGLGKCGECAA
jgi:hypothetical protein